MAATNILSVDVNPLPSQVLQLGFGILITPLSDGGEHAYRVTAPEPQLRAWLQLHDLEGWDAGHLPHGRYATLGRAFAAGVHAPGHGGAGEGQAEAADADDL